MLYNSINSIIHNNIFHNILNNNNTNSNTNSINSKTNNTNNTNSNTSNTKQLFISPPFGNYFPSVIINELIKKVQKTNVQTTSIVGSFTLEPSRWLEDKRIYIVVSLDPSGAWKTLPHVAHGRA